MITNKKLLYGILVVVVVVAGISLFVYLDKPTAVSAPTIPAPPTEPVEILKLSYNVRGCGEKETKEYTKTRGSGKEQKVDVSIDNGFINLTHYLNYVCCAKMEIYLDSLEVRPDHTLVKLKEKNEGKMCRCVCDYEIDMKIEAPGKGKYKIQIFGIEYENMPIDLLWEKEIEVTEHKAVSPQPKDDFCGLSTRGRCLTDEDCMKSGCSGQVCQPRSKLEDPIITTCEFRDCYNADIYGLKCKCVNDECQWYKYPKE